MNGFFRNSSIKMFFFFQLHILIGKGCLFRQGLVRAEIKFVKIIKNNEKSLRR